MHVNTQARAPRRYVEITLVFLTALGKFLFMDTLHWTWQFILVVAFGWLGYILTRRKAAPAILIQWGFRWDNFKTVWRQLLPWAISAVIASFVIGYARGTILFHWHFFPTLLYPLWGVMQQYLCMALVAGNLKSMNRLGDSLIVILTSTLFGLMHLPDPWLAGATFLMALIYAWYYLKEQNLYVLGLYHGALGAIFYFVTLGKDPWVRVWW